MRDGPIPLVSVVVPAFNSERTIRQAIDSALNQTHPRLEVIVCDDASTDGTAQVVASIHDERVILLRNQANRGPGPARDRAIAEARGEYIAMLDADDAWLESRIETLIAESNAGEIVFDDLMLCHDVGDRMLPSVPVHGTKAFGSHGMATIVTLPCFLASDRLVIQPIIPTSHIRRLNLKHSGRRFGEDAEFYINLALDGIPFRYVPRPLYLYRVTPGSLTADPASTGAMQRMLLQFLESPDLPDDIRGALIDKITRVDLDSCAHALARQLRNGRIFSASALIARNPRVIGRIIERFPRYLKYEIHRQVMRIPKRKQ